jgi:hypothetical protein
MDGRKNHSLNWLRTARAILAATVLALLGSAPAMAADPIGETAGQAASGVSSVADQVDHSAATIVQPVASRDVAPAASAQAATQSARSPATRTVRLATSAPRMASTRHSVPASPRVKAGGPTSRTSPATAPAASVTSAAHSFTGSSSAAAKPVTPLGSGLMGTAAGATRPVSQLSSATALAHGGPLPSVAQSLASGSVDGHAASSLALSSGESFSSALMAGHVPAPTVPAWAKTPSGTAGVLAYASSGGASLAGLAASTSTLVSVLASVPASRLVSGPAQSSFRSAPAPPPEPLTGGASPSAAATSGFGFSIFLGLAGLLVLGASSVARRARLAGESCGAPAFALIPERPG